MKDDNMISKHHPGLMPTDAMSGYCSLYYEHLDLWRAVRFVLCNVSKAFNFGKRDIYVIWIKLFMGLN